MPQNGAPVGAERFATVMKAYDQQQNRVRGYDVNQLLASNDPPVLLRLQGGLYVLGGRTRLFAALATGRNINVRVVDGNALRKSLMSQ